jgi:nucleoside-diphosphate-sugar epimerase
MSDPRAGHFTTTKIYDDIDDVDEIKSLPLTHFHQDVDQAVHHAPPNVKTAMITPPTIYGTGANARPKILQIPWLVECILKGGEAFQINEGLNTWDAIHIRDLANIYRLLVESAAAGGGKASWGKDGYYFAESESYVRPLQLADPNK